MKMLRYRVSWNGSYLFHVYGYEMDDALTEARRVASRTMKHEVITGLSVERD